LPVELFSPLANNTATAAPFSRDTLSKKPKH